MTATFVKRRTDVPTDFFPTEAAGLEWLRETNTVAVPEVIEVAADRIVLERIESGRWIDATDEQLGRELAALHQVHAATFGLDRNGYIGDLPMDNTSADDWPTFFATTRIEPLVREAHDAGSLPDDAVVVFDRLVANIAELAGPPEPPVRIHGDLWRGNALADHTGKPWLIDPAAHGGHRETDLAMMRLFGGFGDRCFAAYQEQTPLTDGWQQRVGLHQLHPLLVHTLLFGGGYGAQAVTTARRYV